MLTILKSIIRYLFVISFTVIGLGCTTLGDKIVAASQRQDMPYLIDILQNSKEYYYRKDAARELGKQTKDLSSIIPLLIEALDDKALKRGGYTTTTTWENPNTGELTPSAPEWVSDEYPVREAALKSLQKLTGQDFGMDKVKWQEWWEENKGKFTKIK